MHLRSPGSILLISCYELGHQPLAVAMPMAFLERAGFAPAAADISVEDLPAERVARARVVCISVPMHTAMRLGLRVAERVRELAPDCHIVFYGLYAALNADFLLDRVADSCIGGEFEGPLLALVEALDAGEDARAGADGVAGVIRRGAPAAPHLARLPFAVPSRAALPPLSRYAHLEHGGERFRVAYVEATRGCKYLCRHCPIPPVYGGRFFAVPAPIVLEDVRRQVAAGARHVTFGDPDFLNAPAHSLRIARALHDGLPGVTFDFTAKVAHLLRHGGLLDELADLGCIFIVSAVESLSDEVLEILDKGHTRDDVSRAFELVAGAGIALRPTWVPFTPWTSRDDYLDILDFVRGAGLVDHVDPVQLAVRLLVPPGSHLLGHPRMKPHLGELDAASFSWTWRHPDPAVDLLQLEVAALVEEAAGSGEDPAVTFQRIRELAAGPAPRAPAAEEPAIAGDRVRPPRLTESWFC